MIRFHHVASRHSPEATTLTGTLPFYRYKTGAAGVVDCRSAEGYSPTITLADSPLIDDAIPDEEGFYLLCVQAGNQQPWVTVGRAWTTRPSPSPKSTLRHRSLSRRSLFRRRRILSTCR
ncbi:MAG: hypothetical protein H6654_08055 [Ardenticatenaceae bacterium]|nr:hypothetical protein [Ardenticatenaceae bacterium]